MIAPRVFGELWDGSGTAIRHHLDDLQVSPETLEAIDRISRATRDGVPPHDARTVYLYHQLVLHALCEHLVAVQAGSTTSSTSKGKAKGKMK